MAKTADELFEQATGLRDAGALAEAKAAFFAALAVTPAGDSHLGGAIYTQLAYVESLMADSASDEAKLAHTNQAAEYAKQATLVNENAELPSMKLCLCLLDLGRTKEALEEAIRLLRRRNSTAYQLLLCRRHAEESDPEIAALAETVRELLRTAPLPAKHQHVRLRSNLGGVEEVPACRSQSSFRLQSSPISVMGLAANDLVTVEEDGGFHLERWGGFVSVQIFIETRVGSEVEWMEREIDGLGLLDSIRETSFVANVPDTVGHARITRLMARFLAAFPGCFYQYGNVYDEATEQPMEWMREFLAR